MRCIGRAGRTSTRRRPRLQSADPNIDSRWWIRMRTLIDDGELIIPEGTTTSYSGITGITARTAVIGASFLVHRSWDSRFSFTSRCICREPTI